MKWLSLAAVVALLAPGSMCLPALLATLGTLNRTAESEGASAVALAGLAAHQYAAGNFDAAYTAAALAAAKSSARVSSYSLWGFASAEYVLGRETALRQFYLPGFTYLEDEIPLRNRLNLAGTIQKDQPLWLAPTIQQMRRDSDDGDALYAFKVAFCDAITSATREMPVPGEPYNL